MNRITVVSAVVEPELHIQSSCGLTAEQTQGGDSRHKMLGDEGRNLLSEMPPVAPSSPARYPPICLQAPLLESVPGNYLGIPTWILQNQCQNQPNKPTQGMLISVSSSTALAQGNEDHSAPLGECVHTHSSRRVSVFLCNTSVLKQICLLRRAKD